GIGSDQYDFVGTAEHEISEIMGRVARAGRNLGTADAPYLVYTALDLFRYSAPSQPQLTSGDPSYFSINGGATNLNNFNNPVTGNDGDLGDWAAGAGNDSFNDNSNPGVVNDVSRTD